MYGTGTFQSVRFRHREKTNLFHFSLLVQQEVVSVKHVVNPCRFIVHRQIDADRFRSLENSMSNWALRPDSSKDIPQSVNPGELFLPI